MVSYDIKLRAKQSSPLQLHKMTCSRQYRRIFILYPVHMHVFLDSKVHGANMGPIWGRQDPGAPHVGPMNFAIWDCHSYEEKKSCPLKTLFDVGTRCSGPSVIIQFIIFYFHPKASCHYTILPYIIAYDVIIPISRRQSISWGIMICELQDTFAMRSLDCSQWAEVLSKVFLQYV